jgi:hypothetical protein
MRSTRSLLLLFGLLSISIIDGEQTDANWLSVKINHLRKPQQAVGESEDPTLDTVQPSANTTTPAPTVAPTPSPSENKTDAPTTAPPTTAPPTTIAPTSAPPTTAAPTSDPNKHHHHHHHHDHDWWAKVRRLVFETIIWGVLAVLFFFAFGGIFSNRYRIYYYLRGSWYSFYHRVFRRRDSGNSAPSSTLNEIIFSDDTLQEGLLMRET